MAALKKPARRKHNIAKEFTQKRTGKFTFLLSRAKFRFLKFSKWVLAFSIVFALSAATVGFIFFSQFFAVQTLQLVRQDFRANIAEISAEVEEFRGNNIFLISKKRVAEKLQKKFSQIETITVEKIFPRTLKIAVQTFPIVARWKIFLPMPQTFSVESAVVREMERKSATFFINRVGQVSDSNPDDGDAFLIFENEEKDQPFALGDRVIAMSRLQEILQSKQELERIFEKQVVTAEFFRSAAEIHFSLASGTKIWVDFSSPQKDQIAKLDFVKDKSQILANGNIEYFDLRVFGKIFWKEHE